MPLRKEGQMNAFPKATAKGERSFSIAIGESTSWLRARGEGFSRRGRGRELSFSRPRPAWS